MLSPYFKLLLCCGFMSLFSCIQNDYIDDYVDPVVRITNKIDSLRVGNQHDLEVLYFNNVGLPEQATIVWQSQDTSVAKIAASGRLAALKKGQTWIFAQHTEGGRLIRDSFYLTVTELAVVVTPTEKNGSLRTTSSYILTGDFNLKMEGTTLKLTLAANYRASSNLPGLYVYLANNPNTTAGAYEIGRVTVFSGTHNYAIPNVNLSDYRYVLYYCKPFNSKVGDGLIP